jgi:hypothetical protein
MTSPCGNIRIPINEEGQEKAGQIQEYLDRYHGEGVQHIAMGSTNLYKTVDSLRAAGVALLTTPETYYEAVDRRIPGHGESVEELRKRHILIDGTAGRFSCRSFPRTSSGRSFFEFIQRKGNEGFGEGNFKALFESIEQDQIRPRVSSTPERRRSATPRLRAQLEPNPPRRALRSRRAHGAREGKLVECAVSVGRRASRSPRKSPPSGTAAAAAADDL